MEGKTNRFIEIDKLELLNRASAYNKSAAKGAEVLYKNDVNGEVFLTMTNDDFKDLGIDSFGVRKSLMMFRDKVLKSEASFNLKSHSTPKGPQKKVNNSQLLDSITDCPIAEAQTEEIKEDLDEEILEMDYQPGATILGELSMDVFSSDEEIFQKPKPKPKAQATLAQQGENNVLNDCKSCFNEVPNIKKEKMPRVGYKDQQKIHITVTDFSREESNSELRSINKKKNPGIELLSPKRSRTNENSPRHDTFDDCSSVEQSEFHLSDYRSTCPMRSIGKLKDWIVNDTVTWQEDGKRKSADTFSQLRSDHDMLLEGYIQKLTGVNSKWMVNHWTSRYAVLLKTGVLLIFQYDRKTLYQKASTDLRTVKHIGEPKSDVAAGILKFEIVLTRKRIVLGFKSESKLLMWRNDIVPLVKGYDSFKTEEEKKNM